MSLFLLIEIFSFLKNQLGPIYRSNGIVNINRLVKRNKTVIFVWLKFLAEFELTNLESHKNVKGITGNCS